MSFVIAVPEFLSAAATDLANLGSTISAANAAASIPTTGVLAAGADDVSAAIAALFGAHAQAYQTISAQAATFHAQFVQTLSAGAGAYANAEAANVQQSLLNAINAPTQALLGRPLIGDGADGTAPGQNGGAGGLLYGNGGNGAAGVNAGIAGGSGGAAGLIGNGGSGGAGGAGAAGAAAASGVEDQEELQGPFDIDDFDDPSVAVLARLAVGAVADQRAPGGGLDGRVEHVDQALQRRCGGNLGDRIGPRTRGQGLHKLVMKRCRPRAERLKIPPVGGKQRSDRRRHLIRGRGLHRAGLGRRDRASQTERRADAGHLCCRCGQRSGQHAHIRHATSPPTAT